MSISSTTHKIWFITGTSTGLGREFVKAVLDRGDKVIATARDISHIEDLCSDNCKILRLDVTEDFQTIERMAKEAIDIWGHVDVVLNNAGMGVMGFVEEVGEHGAMLQMKTNYFGPLNITNAFLPHLRARRSGTIVFIGTILSRRKMSGAYCASKAALEAASEVLSVELKPFNIRVLNVLPGGLRTKSWENTVKLFGQLSSAPRFSDYDTVREQGMKWAAANDGTQPGSAQKAADAIVSIVREEGGNDSDDKGAAANREWPLLLALGSDAEQDIRSKCARVLKCLDEWEDVSRAIAYDI